MNRDVGRRALLAALAGAGVGGAALSPAGEFLDQFAPLSGRVWRSADERLPGTVESPHGEATVTYDDHGVPHVEAESEAAAYYAVGYVQAADRLFQMDLFRRRMRGTLSAAFGERTVESDRLFTELDFLGAARASREAIEGSRAGRMVEAYRDGVNDYRADRPLPLEFGLVGYEPAEWTVVDTLLVGLQVAWGLTGSVRTLRHAVLREELGDETYRRLYGRPFDHGTPIVREGRTGGTVQGTGGSGDREDALRGVDADFVDELARIEPPDLIGSNHWVVSGEYTDTGRPIFCYDPHLPLTVPPVWYEQRVSAGGTEVRGAALPGIPFVIAGESDHCAWGFTNSGADVVDFYTYETDGDRYRYRDEWREFETETRTIEVAGGEDRDVEIRKTVHGAYVERELGGESRHVAMAWTGLTGTRETEAIYGFARAESRAEFRDALRNFDVPTQNVLYADRDGSTFFRVGGKIPVRRVDGEVVRGDRVFDGSAGEAEWEGYTPYGQSSWEGFVPPGEKPGVLDPDYLATANQRPADDPTYPIGQEYASGFRGIRIYERLDEAIETGRTVDRAFMASVQGDTLDVRARILVPALLDARDRMPPGADPWLDALAEWDYRMDPDSRAALVFHWFAEFFREEAWSDDFEEMGLGEDWWPAEWTLVTLPADDEFFGGDRAGVMAAAMERAVERIESEGWETYGDHHVTAVDHEFGSQVAALNYPRYPTGGSAFTPFNVHPEAEHGSSWRQVSTFDGNSLSVVPGGNDGSYFSDNYDDQLELWAAGEYKGMDLSTPDRPPAVSFRGEDG